LLKKKKKCASVQAAPPARTQACKKKKGASVQAAAPARTQACKKKKGGARSSRRRRGSYTILKRHAWRIPIPFWRESNEALSRCIEIRVPSGEINFPPRFLSKADGERGGGERSASAIVTGQVGRSITDTKHIGGTRRASTKGLRRLYDLTGYAAVPRADKVSLGPGPNCGQDLILVLR
jgi:hypothetical protein